jgi:hypothetical protein
VVRSGTLFYLDLAPVQPLGSDNRFSKGSALVHRYNLSSHSEIGTPIRLGDTFSNAGSEGNITIPGWDASPDGAQIAYERLTVTLPTSGTLMETAQFFAAHADGSAATPMLTGTTPPLGTFSGALLSISPNGLLVAATHAGSTPDVVSGNMSGGPAHFYTPSVAGPPIWLATNCGFEADMGDGPGLGIEGFTLNAGSATAQSFTAVPNASAPAILA